MYIPADYNEPNPDAMRELIVQHPFGSLITHGERGLDANHIPFELMPGDGGLGELHAHLARANPVCQDVANGDEVLVIFRAGDAYISPNWYPSKQATHREVPTWNYRVVHAHGRITVCDDEQFVRGVVARLTRTHEASQPVPWKMGDAPKDYIDTMLQSIVGLRIEITRLVGKRKLGQNKAEADIRGAGEALVADGHLAIGEAMLAEADAKRE